MKINHVQGEKKKNIMLYALSTCVWCKQTKKLLDKLGVDYFYIDVDLLEGKEKEQIAEIVEKWNPSGSFPVIVIDDNDCVVGYDTDEIKEKIGL